MGSLILGTNEDIDNKWGLKIDEELRKNEANNYANTLLKDIKGIFFWFLLCFSRIKYPFRCEIKDEIQCGKKWFLF